VVVTADGELATDNHVAKGLHKIKVTTADGKTYDAGVDSFNKHDDVALLTLQRNDDFEVFVPLALSKNSNLQKGQQVMAVGHPGFRAPDGSYHLSPQNKAFMSPGTFEEPHTLTDLTKDIVAEERAAIVGEENTNRTLLQTAEHTEGGDSGAPLVASDGTVVGIVDYYSKDAPEKRAITESTPVEDIARLLDRTRQLRSRASYGMTALDLSNDPGVNV
jgi:putative serine protease PepD